MRAFLLAAAAAALFALPDPASAQGFGVEVGPGGIRVNPGGRAESGQCRELRLACENRERLGERGEGNCRRYRMECGGGGSYGRVSRQDMCAQLRASCLNKRELGEEGEGNCRRYRRTCRGSY